MIDCSTNTASPFNKNWSRVTLAWTFLHSSDTDKSRYDEIASTFSKSFLRATNQYSLWSIIDFWSLLKMKKYHKIYQPKFTYSKSTLESPEQCMKSWRCSGFSIVDSEQILHIALVNAGRVSNESEALLQVTPRSSRSSLRKVFCKKRVLKNVK